MSDEVKNILAYIGAAAFITCACVGLFYIIAMTLTGIEAMQQ